ncbi:MAG TPA: hypothetical protein VIM25_06940, partial [Candidatus Limnocylindrales bacterium]
FRLDEVSPDVRDLVVATSSPRQEIVLGYWQDLFERSAQELDAMVEMGRRRDPGLRDPICRGGRGRSVARRCGMGPGEPA